MKNIGILAIILLVGVAGAGRAEGQKCAAGIILGDSNGLSAKLWLPEPGKKSGKLISPAIDFAFGLNRDNTYLHLTFLSHNYSIISKGDLSGDIPLYYGIGLKYNSVKQKANTGIRFCIGIEYLFKEIPFDIFGEFVPVLNISPDITAELSVGLGIRYLFELK